MSVLYCIPQRNKKKEQPITLLDILQEQKASKYSGGMDTALPEEVADKMKALLTEYNGKEAKTFEDILDFHVKFERIHPFQDGNGCVGRLIMFKECLKYNIIPFIIEDNLKMFYYRGLKEWNNEKADGVKTGYVPQKFQIPLSVPMTVNRFLSEVRMKGLVLDFDVKSNEGVLPERHLRTGVRPLMRDAGKAYR